MGCATSQRSSSSETRILPFSAGCPARAVTLSARDPRMLGTVAAIERELMRDGFAAAMIHGDRTQAQRTAALNSFEEGSVKVLVATDVLSRGIDIKDISLVINYDVPGDAEDYVHRVGRTARAETTGVAITLVNEADMLKMHRIERLIEYEVYKAPLPAELGPGPEWKLKTSTPREYFKKKKSKSGEKSRGVGFASPGLPPERAAL